MSDEIRPPVVEAPTIVAVYDDTEDARAGLEELHKAGVDQVHVSVVGPRLDEEQSREVQRELESDEGRNLLVRAFKGGLAGGALGTAAGTIGVLAIPGLGPSLVGGALIALHTGGAAALAGGAAGVATSSAGWDESWEATFGDVDDDEVLVLVHGRDENLLETAHDALRKTDPRELRRSASGEQP